MAYRLVEITVRRFGLCGYAATATLEDDGEGQVVAGFDIEVGPYDAITHKRAWRKALRAHGGRLWLRTRDED